MKIAVCVKWVPVLSRIRFDSESRRIIRDGVPHELNSYDALAVQWAVELKTSHEVEVTVYTMGPPQAKQALVLCLAKGADRAIHLVDQAFAGSDTLATARALSMALKRELYDLVLFGAHSHDAETGQVGPEVAELLGLPQITSVKHLEILSDHGLILAERQLEYGTQRVECPMPVVIAVSEGITSSTFPSRDAINEAMTREIPELTAADLSSDPALFGALGSPTWVAEIRYVEPTREQLLLEGTTPDEAALQVSTYLKERGVLTLGATNQWREETTTPLALRSIKGPGVWVVAETERDRVTSATLELLGAAQRIAGLIDGHVAAVLLGGPEINTHSEILGYHGADVVYVGTGTPLAGYFTEAYGATLSAAIRLYRPYAVLSPSTVNGRDLAARVAARLELGLTGDCIGMEVDEQGRLVQLKPAFGDSVIAPILSRTAPAMVTVRPGLFTEPQPNIGRHTSVIPLSVCTHGSQLMRVIRTTLEESVDVSDLGNARVLVGVGKGVGGLKGIIDLQSLVKTLGAQVVCTRDVVEAGWLPKQRQVGLTGRSLRPDLYIAIGIRGDLNHMIGIRHAGTVIAINNNKRSPIFRHADIGIVTDWQHVVPALFRELKLLRG